MGRDDLIEKLKGATEGSRELDAFVECFLKGRRISRVDHQRVYWIKGIGCGAIDVIAKPAEVPAYTTDLNAALALVEEKLPGCAINMQTSFGPDRSYRVVIQADVRGRVLGLSDEAETLPLALLTALLTALKEQDNG